MKERFKKISQKLDTYIKTKQFRWLKGLVLVLGFVLTNCVSFLGGYFLNRDDNMIYKKNINALVESQTAQKQTEPAAVTTVPETSAPPPVTTTVTTIPPVNGSVLASKIQYLYFPDTEYPYSNVCEFENRNTVYDIQVPLTKKSFKISYDGMITAAVDTSSISVSADDSAKIITVIIPQAEIISHEIDPESFSISDKKDNLFNPILSEDYMTICQSQNQSMEDRAVKNGLYERVYENTEKIISDFISQDPAASANNYTVKYIIEKSY